MWAVIPVKQIRKAKQRLSPVLNSEERRLFFSAMLEDVLSVMVKINLFEKIIVATKCPNAISIANRYGVSHFQTGPDRGLSQAALETVNFLEANGIQGMFLIPADIPLLNATEIHSVLRLHPSAPSVTIVPSHDRLGSNCIVLTPPSIMPLRFGPNSFVRHQEIARKIGLQTNSMVLPGFGIDIDNPKDLSIFSHAKGKTRSQNYLRQIKFRERIT